MKWSKGWIALGMCATLLAGCGQKNEAPEQEGATTVQEGGKEEQGMEEIAELKIAFAPYDASEAILAATEPLSALLKEELATRGYAVDTVSMTVGASYEAVGEALSAGTADVGFISGGTYTLYDTECDVLLTALRKAYSKDSTNPVDWNDGTPGIYTEDMAKYYRSIILAGPSELGQKLAEKVNRGEALTWEELNSATWVVMSASSASGYIYPSLYLLEHYGKGISGLAHVVQSDSYATSMARLASEQADILVSFGHVQNKYEKQWQEEFGRTEPIWTETNVLAVTEGIYNDTVSVSKASPIMTEAFREALAESLIAIGGTPEGQKIIQTFAHTGYEKAVASDYDGEREAQKLLLEE